MNNLNILLDTKVPEENQYLQETAMYHKMGLHNYTNLNEAYFGGNEEFQRAEMLLAKIKKVVDRYPATSQLRNKDLAEIYELGKGLEDVFAEVFGIRNMLINLASMNVPNAFTFSVNGTWSSFVPKKLKVYNGKYGIQFDPKHKVNVNMTVTLPLIKICEPREIIAIMIHEMGHNLNRNRSIADKMILLPGQLLWGWLAPLINSEASINAIKEEREKMIDENAPKKEKQEGVLSKIAAKTKDSFVNIVFRAALAMPIYKEERYSDSLAAAYGYGTEITTGLQKLFPGRSYTQEYGPFFTATLAVLLCVDPHPERITRARYVKEYLNNELKTNRNLSKKEREKLELDVKNIDALIKLSFDAKDGGDNVGLRRSMEKHFGVTDIREKFLKQKHDKIDKKTRSFEKLYESATPEELPLLQEAFYGGNDNLDKIEKEFKKIITNLNNSKQKYTIENLADKLTSQDKYMIIKGLNKIEDEFKKLFGVREMYIEPIVKGLAAVATLSVQSSLGVYGKKLKVYKGDTAVQFNPKAGVNIIMFLGYENLLLMNEKELTAVFLHEFGHNLNRTQTLPSKFWMKVPTLSKFLVSFILSDNYVDTIKEYRNEDSKSDANAEKKGPMKKLMNMLSDKFILEPMSRLFLKNNAYREEKFSDAFAAMFGYGQDVHTALRKFDEYYFKKFGSITRNEKYSRFRVYKEFMHQLSDPHPERVARIRSTINYIENELKNNRENLSKKSIDILEQDLKVLSDIDKTDVKDGGVGNVALRQAIMKVTGGAVDIREILIKDKYKKIDKKMQRFDALEESVHRTEALYECVVNETFGRPLIPAHQVRDLKNLVETSIEE